MIRFILHTDFNCDAQFRSSPELSLSVFSIKDYVYDYMHTYKVSHLELFMSQNYDIPFEYQFDCYADFDDSGSLINFYTIRQYDKLKCKLHTTIQEIF